MANQIRLKRASGSDPSASDLVTGEVAVRTDNGKLFTKKDDGSVAEISGGGIDDGDKGDITVSNSGATFTIDNGVIDNDNIATNAAISASKISGVMPTSGGAFTGNVSISDNAIEFDSDSGNTNKVSLQGPSSLSTNITLTLPNTDGNNLQALKSDGAGNLFFGNVVKDNTEIISLYDQTSPIPIQRLLASSEGVTVKGTAAAVSKLMFRDRTTANFLKFKPVDTLSAEVEFTLPAADGSANTVLKTDGSGVMSFGTIVNASVASNAAIAGSKLANPISLPDDHKISFGTGSDNNLEIFHESSTNTNEIIAVDGDIHIQCDDFMVISDSTAGRTIYVDEANSRLELGFDGFHDAYFAGNQVTFTSNVDANAGLDVTGNITVSGTVDGRDLATDGSKLDGIAAGATNVTNTNQLTNGAGFITATLTNEQVQDIVGNMVTGNTESGISVTYQDSDGTLDFSVSSQTDNNFTTTLKNKLDGIAAGATNVTNTNQLTNGAGFITATLTNEQVQDIVGNMVSGNSESGITVTYQDSDGTLDFSVASQTDNNFTDADHSKLDGIAAGANNITNTNQLTNGAGFVTSSIINSLNASNLSSGTIPDARFPATLPAISGANLTNLPATGGATGGGSDEVFYENDQTVTANYTITNGKNAMAAGPITINSGVTVTVGSGETLTIV